MIKLILFMLILILAVMVFFLSVFVYGLFPALRARNLSDIDREKIKESGIIHKTTKRGVEGILHGDVFKGKYGLPAYSNQFRKSAFFFISEYLKTTHEQFNDSAKYKYIIKIDNITDVQMEKMKIRKYDKALIVCGNFDILAENTVKVSEIVETKGEKSKRILFSFIKQFFRITIIYQILAFLISSILVLGVSVLLYILSLIIYFMCK